MNQYSHEQAYQEMEEIGEAVGTYLSDSRLIALTGADDTEARYDVHFAGSVLRTPQGFVGGIKVTFYRPDKRAFSFYYQIPGQKEYRIHYLALLAATDIAIGLKLKHVSFGGHSLRAVNAINGTAHVTDTRVVLLIQACRVALKTIGNSRVSWMPQYKNSQVPTLTYLD